MTRPTSNLDWGGSQVEPSGGEKTAGFAFEDQPPAEWFNWLLGNVDQWIKYLDAEKLLDVEQDSADVPIIATTNVATDHPGSSSNKWKLFFRMYLPDGTKVRFYAGNGVDGNWAITTNAAWQPANANQNWISDASGQGSRILRDQDDGLHLYGKAPTASSWEDDEWDTALGTLFIGDDVHAGDKLTCGGNAEVTGNALIGGEAFADAYRYNSPLPTRSVLVPILDAQRVNNAAVSADTTGWDVSAAVSRLQALSAGTSCYVPISRWLPNGATLNSIDVLVDQATSAGIVCTAQKVSHNFASPGLTTTSIGTATGNSSTGLKVITISSIAHTVASDADTLHVLLTSGAIADRVHAIRLNYTDPGPRNH